MTLSLGTACARLFVVGFPGRALDPDLLGLVNEGVLGAILFGRNVGEPAETAALVRALKTAAGRPFPVSVDQEGGRVARLRGGPYTRLPPMRAIGGLGDTGTARRVGALLAYELRALGFDWDFAPVLDVDTNPRNPVIGDRAFAADAETVARLGVALARGLEAGGVASCGKHFPGHGDTTQDSHRTLPVLSHGLDRLRAVELLPFRRYAEAGLASVMTAHVRFPALGEDVPATVSPRALTTLLREELGFAGVVVSDDLEMKAIEDPERAAAEGLRAGVDVFLVCHHADVQRRCIAAVRRAVERGQVPERRLREALDRTDALVRRFVRPPEDRLAMLGAPEHRTLAKGLADPGAAGADPTTAGV